VFGSLTRAKKHELVAHYLELVGLGDAMNKKPAELSAGMRQRVGIARAFALQPKLLLLDEPFGMLDSLTRYELQQVLLDLWGRDRKTALMVTHDVDEALFLSDRVAMMTSGPRARLGGILEIPFARPRDRAAIMNEPRYYELREQLIGFLNSAGAREGARGRHSGACQDRRRCREHRAQERLSPRDLWAYTARSCTRAVFVVGSALPPRRARRALCVSVAQESRCAPSFRIRGWRLPWGCCCWRPRPGPRPQRLRLLRRRPGRLPLHQAEQVRLPRRVRTDRL
jgi:energy-coupling factor transporter ATP-binding protein EcfA2